MVEALKAYQNKTNMILELRTVPEHH